MDKQLFKAYVRTLVEDEVKKILPEMLTEAVSEIKSLQETTGPVNAARTKPKLDRSKLAQVMGISYDGETLRANSTNVAPSRLPENAPTDVDPAVIEAVTRDYSSLMKKMGIT